MHKTRFQHDATTSVYQQLHAENQQLRQQLNEVFVHAKQNERKLKHIQAQEHKLVSSRSVYTLIDNLINQYRYSARLDVVTLCLIDPEYEIQRILQEAGINPQDMPGLSCFSDDQVLNELFQGSRKPILGSFDKQRFGQLFPGMRQTKTSVALLPLYEHKRIIGSINLGSRLHDRFNQSAGTDFLERLATIFPLCLENTLNQERLKKVGLTDPLTGVNNRRFFDQRLEEEVIRAQRDQTPLCCLFLDIDKFKNVNDTHGHQVGDRVLAQTASLIRQQLRVTDVLGRYGGEEFSTLLATTDLTKAEEIAQRIRAAIADFDFILPDNSVLKVTMSIGISIYQGSPGDVFELGEELVRHADEAVYQAKKGGRNRVIIYARAK